MDPPPETMEHTYVGLPAVSNHNGATLSWDVAHEDQHQEVPVITAHTQDFWLTPPYECGGSSNKHFTDFFFFFCTAVSKNKNKTWHQYALTPLHLGIGGTFCWHKGENNVRPCCSQLAERPLGVMSLASSSLTSPPRMAGRPHSFTRFSDFCFFLTFSSVTGL